MIMITDNNDDSDEKPKSNLLWWCQYWYERERSLLKKKKNKVSVGVVFLFVRTARQCFLCVLFKGQHLVISYDFIVDREHKSKERAVRTIYHSRFNKIFTYFGIVLQPLNILNA